MGGNKELYPLLVLWRGDFFSALVVLIVKVLW